MGDLRDLMRDYERARYPEHRRLDLQGEGPESARERALQWIQSRAHEEPGQDVLLIVARGGRPGRAPDAIEMAVRKLLEELEGKLIEWWQPFAPGSLALKIALAPTVRGGKRTPPELDGDGRTPETAGAARPLPARDIPADLLDLVTRVAEIRIEREGLSTKIIDVLLREVWIEAQAIAMEDRLTFEQAILRVRDEEMRKRLED